MKQISRYLLTLALLMTVASGAWAAITTEDIGKVICTDGSLYATKILAQNDGKTAAAMIGYVDTENNKALAIALADGPNNKNWTQACEYCTGLNTSSPVASGTWVLPTEEQWNSVLTLEAVGNFMVYKSESLNTKLSAAKGNAIDNDGGTYWSATESADGNFVKCLAFKYGMASPGTVNKTVTDGSMTRAFLEIELSGVEVTTNAEEGETTFTEASFAMPAYDATADYELVRDMSIQMTATMGDGTDGVRYRVKKSQQGQGYEPADMNKTQVLALVAVNDDIEHKALTLDQDYFCRIYKLDEQTLQPEGDGVKLSDFDFAPGLYALKAFAQDDSDYDGETALSNTFKLFQGYEVQVAAKEFVTYYKDEPLYADTETSADAELYTITSVSADQATLSAAIQTAPSLTPLLIFNNSDQAKTFLLIPANEEPNLALTVAPEFQGTLTGTTIAASTEGQTNYALNGLQFVWVKNAVEIGANKAWLSVNTGVPSARITIVFDETTKIANTNITNLTNGNWYDLNGRKLDKMPTKKGIYMNNGRKVVVK